MKNIQVIDGAVNCVYYIFSATNREFSLIFPAGQDIAFIDEVMASDSAKNIDAVFKKLWKRRVPKSKANGIHGILFYDLEEKKPFYPTRRDEEAENPGKSRLR